MKIKMNMTPEYTDAYCKTCGVMSAIIDRLFPIILVFGLVFGLSHIAGCEMDDTDLSATNRSGLHLHLDAGTGVEYLSTRQGHLIKRELRKKKGE